jgi:DNA-binding CsgD family transcriptional regulator/tetratricopeptide (TPR) repeat protein
MGELGDVEAPEGAGGGSSAGRAEVAAEAVDRLERGRAAYAGWAWADACASLMQADEAAPLEAEDLELLATSLFMLGRVDEFLIVLERAYQTRLDDGDGLRAARCAFYLGVNLAVQGEVGRATAWFGRAQRLVEREGRDCVELGYLLMPVAMQREAAGDFEAAYAAASTAVEIGERFRDRDLSSLAMHAQGLALIKHGRVPEGLALLDEAMLAASGGELSPIITGVVYCGVIAGCEEAFELRRAREWTDALARWCDRQPELVAFSGRCLAHRAEIMQLDGAWPDALEEARRARERSERAMNRAAAAQAVYLQGEVLRLQGNFGAAEAAYRDANQDGREPQPGLALLRHAQGDTEAAAAALRRALAETAEPLKRARLLPAHAEIMVAVGDDAEARRASRELEEIAKSSQSAMLRAVVEQVRGMVELAEGDPRSALISLRRGWQTWQELGAPYEAARTRVLVGLACRALGDEETAEMELEAARAVFDRLGAAPDVSRAASLTRREESRPTHGLTGRELEVLRLVAQGKTNREIASALVVSEHTVARHLQNIFGKLRVSSRAAATAFAFEHGLF